jgi:hypothetical protein
MANIGKTKNFWLGWVIFAYSFILFLQGIWVLNNYQFIYPTVLDPFVSAPNHNWVLQMIGAIAPSTIGGILFMIIGLHIKNNKHNPRASINLSVLGYSLILLIQALWLLFIFPNFYQEVTRYLSNGIFMDYTRFFRILAVTIPPLVGFAIFMTTGAILTKNSLQKDHL